jgi:APA family basic amino acid/polyamine antiporter
VNARTESPVVATVFTGSIVAVLAFFVPLEVLADLVSMGTLVAFTSVTISVAVRARYSTEAQTPKYRVALPCFLVIAGSCLIAFPYYYKLHYGILIAGAAVFTVGTLLFYTVPKVYTPEGFAVPLNPILPCLGTLANIFLIGEGR